MRGEVGSDGGEISLQAAGEGVKRGQLISLGCGKPARKVLALALGEHDGEGADVLTERCKLRAPG